MIKASDFGSEAKRIGNGDESDLRRRQTPLQDNLKRPFVEDSWTTDDALRSMLFIRRGDCSACIWLDLQWWVDLQG